MAQATAFEANDVDAEPQIDRAKELQAVWQTARGQVWAIPSKHGNGTHKIMCGDSTSAEDVGMLMGDKRADMVFTDPPYGVAISEKNEMLNSFQKAGRNLTPIENDALPVKDLKELLTKAFKLAKSVMNDACSVYMTAPQGGELGTMMMMMMDAGLPIRHVLIWVKNAPTFSMGRLDYDYQHEPILYTWNKSHKFYREGEQDKSVWYYDKPRSSADHPTMKPVALVVNAIKNSTKTGDIILDPFLGSGTSIVACEQTGRIGYGMELSPEYTAVCLQRLSDIGLTPMLVTT
jgi:DNA modification methylase